MNSPSDESTIELKAPALEVAAPIVTEKITLLDTEPRERSATALWILAFIAIIAALYLARAFLVPLLFGILVSYTLSPVVDWFERYRIPTTPEISKNTATSKNAWASDPNCSKPAMPQAPATPTVPK